MKPLLFLLAFLNTSLLFSGETSKDFINKGWNALVTDSDIVAINYFNRACEKATIEKDTENIAASNLYLGICSFSVSFSQGMNYCMRAMDEYKKFEHVNPALALEGRSRCLQLISTIYSRQGKFRESIALSIEALAGFTQESDTAGYRGLIYNSLGVAYKNLLMPDSSEYFHRMALDERLKQNNLVYLPASYLNVGEIEMQKGNKSQSRTYFDRALFIADSSGNRQAQVLALIALGKWNLNFEKNIKLTGDYFQKATDISNDLSDKSYYIKSLESMMRLQVYLNDFKKALEYQQQIIGIRDTIHTYDKQKAIQNLEVQFNIAEKERQLKLVQKEKDIAHLTNYLLYGTIASLILIATCIIYFLRRNSKRDKLLIQTKEELVLAIEEKKRMKELQMQNELEYKESQLSAMAIQMLQKNELMQELKVRLEGDEHLKKDSALNKIINKGENHDKEWTDFNSQFESINKNFYSRIKESYPDISPNDMKICALIKLNLSIKEMAGILNISPDSVKTARYRLRKKLQLNTEDNLTEFILGL